MCDEGGKVFPARFLTDCLGSGLSSLREVGGLKERLVVRQPSFGAGCRFANQDYNTMRYPRQASDKRISVLLTLLVEVGPQLTMT